MNPVTSGTAEQTFHIGEALGRLIESRFTIALNGDLGAGKTTFVKGLAKGMGVSEKYHITSPTFTIINEYPGRLSLCHMDLYRLSDASELDYLGIDDLLADDHVIIVEWPQLLYDISFQFDLEINFEFDDNYFRKIHLIATGHPGSNLLSNLIL